GGGMAIAIGDLGHAGAVGDAEAIDANDPAFLIGNRGDILWRAHLAGATGMVGAFAMLADEGVNLTIRLHVFAGLDFASGVFLHDRLLEQFAGEAHAGAEFLPVIGMGHVVEQDL